MTNFVLEVDCSKAAFGPGGKPTTWRDADRALEVSRILREVADRISREPQGDDAPLIFSMETGISLVRLCSGARNECARSDAHAQIMMIAGSL
jgi:hypothetical protein